MESNWRTNVAKWGLSDLNVAGFPLGSVAKLAARMTGSFGPDFVLLSTDNPTTCVTMKIAGDVPIFGGYTPRSKNVPGLNFPYGFVVDPD